MSRKAIQSAIVDILNTVNDIGEVHGSIRWTIYENEFIKNFFAEISGQSQIRTWMVSRVEGGVDYGARNGSLGTGIPVSTQTALERYDFIIEGWASFSDLDSTDTEFQALIDSIIDKFIDNITLNTTANMRGPINYSIDHQFFGDHFVHHIIFNFYAVELEGISPT